MKKIKNLIIFFILFIIHANINYGVEIENYEVTRAKSNGKMIFLLIGLVLISIVLFLGYKMDKMEENINRKKKYRKEEKRSYNPFSFISQKSKKDDYELFAYDELASQNNKNGNEQVEMIGESAAGDNLYNIDLVEKNENIEFEDKKDIVSNEIINNSQEKSVEDDKERKIENQELDVISNIFSKKDENINILVKGYDYNLEDDLDLLDIENTIKAANIKKYTRKKVTKDDNIEKKEKVEEPKAIVKHYTRKIGNSLNKKNNKNDKNDKKTKRYTRKIIVENNVDSLIEKEESSSELNNVLEQYLEEPDKKINDSSIDSNVENDNIDEMTFLSKIVDLESIDDNEIDFKINQSSNLLEEQNEDDIAKNTKEEKSKIKRGRKPKVENEGESIDKLPKSKRGRKPKTEKDSKIKEKKTTNKEEKPKAKRGRKPKIKTEEEELRQAIEMLPKSRRGRKPKTK